MKSLITNLNRGTVITGKWHNKSYTIVSKLGNGAVGTVYLAINNQKQVALKISEQASSITSEVNVLKSFQKVQGARLGPSLLDVDDFAPSNHKQYSFYVMEYLQGSSLNTFLAYKGNEWLPVLMIQLLSDLEALHGAGWVFGDLKPENLIVTAKPPRLKWIDVGGTTQIGRAIKEYTEFYDRGYWGLGSRKAEPSYDLFAVAMIMIQVFYPKRFDKGPHPEKTLKYKINQHPELQKYAPFLYKALHGQYSSSKVMKNELTRQLISFENQKKQNSITVKKQPQNTVTRAKYKKQPSKWVESVGIVLVTLVFFMIFLILQ